MQRRTSINTTEMLKQLREKAALALARTTSLDSYEKKSAAIKTSIEEIQEWSNQIKRLKNPLHEDEREAECKQAFEEAKEFSNTRDKWVCTSGMLFAFVLFGAWDTDFLSQLHWVIRTSIFLLPVIESVLQPCIKAIDAAQKSGVAIEEISMLENPKYQSFIIDLMANLAKTMEESQQIKRQISLWSPAQINRAQEALQKNSGITTTPKKFAWMGCSALNTFLMLCLRDAIKSCESLPNGIKLLAQIAVVIELFTVTIMLYNKKRNAVDSHEMTHNLRMDMIKVEVDARTNELEKEAAALYHQPGK